MLNRLFRELNKIQSVSERLDSLKAKATKEPTTVEDLSALIRLSSIGSGFEELTIVEHTQVMAEFTRCRQILVQKDDYFYI
jgi:hypothetical protein